MIIIENILAKDNIIFVMVSMCSILEIGYFASSNFKKLSKTELYLLFPTTDQQYR